MRSILTYSVATLLAAPVMLTTIVAEAHAQSGSSTGGSSSNAGGGNTGSTGSSSSNRMGTGANTSTRAAESRPNTPADLAPAERMGNQMNTNNMDVTNSVSGTATWPNPAAGRAVDMNNHTTTGTKRNMGTTRPGSGSMMDQRTGPSTETNSPSGSRDSTEGTTTR